MEGKTTSKETWKPVLGYEGAYEVSTMGNVRSITRRYIPFGKKFARLYQGKNIKPAYRDGYLRVQLTDLYGKRKNLSVHRLVMITFVGLPVGDRNIVDHKNEKRDDNRLSNLRWCTLSENSLASVKNRKKRNGHTRTTHS